MACGNLILCRKQDDRQFLCRITFSNLLAHFVPRNLGHHNIQQNQIRLILLYHLQRLYPVISPQHPIRLGQGLDAPLHQLNKAEVIIHHQYLFDLWQALNLIEQLRGRDRLRQTRQHPQLFHQPHATRQRTFNNRNIADFDAMWITRVIVHHRHRMMPLDCRIKLGR